MSRKIVEHSVKHLVAGMEVVNDVYSADGAVLISGGTVLNKQNIERLVARNISSIKVFAEVLVSPITDPAVKQFMNGYTNSVTAIQRTFDIVRAGRAVPIESLEQTASSIVENVDNVGNILDQLYNLPPCDDATHRHCINVSVISASIALWIGYPIEIVNEISLTGLLHDIGVSKLPPELIRKNKSTLTKVELEHYKKHVAYGVDLMRQSEQKIPESVILGISQHHLREDNSGYPKEYESDEIHPYAKIIAVADMYDEELTLHDTPPKLTPYTCLETLRDNAYKLHPQACITLVDKMVDYLSGNLVALTDGRSGRVVCVNKGRPSRSIVQLECGDVVDLSEDPSTRIHHLLR